VVGTFRNQPPDKGTQGKLLQGVRESGKTALSEAGSRRRPAAERAFGKSEGEKNRSEKEWLLRKKEPRGKTV